MWCVQVRFPYIYTHTMHIGTKRINQILEVQHMFDWDHKADEVQLIYAYWERVAAEALISSE